MLDADAFDQIAASPNLVEFFKDEERPGLRCHAGNAFAWRCRVLDLRDERTALVARAEQAEKDIATFGIIELMVRNPNVDSFVREHEKRTEQAERDRDTLAKEVRAWRPIETAPKDGTRLVLHGLQRGSWGYSPDEYVTTFGRWDKNESRWINEQQQGYIHRPFIPSLWLPLPEAPG